MHQEDEDESEALAEIAAAMGVLRNRRVRFGNLFPKACRPVQTTFRAAHSLESVSIRVNPWPNSLTTSNAQPKRGTAHPSAIAGRRTHFQIRRCR